MYKIDEKIRINKTKYSDKEIKELLKYYNFTFKKPLKFALKEYYRIKFNPKIKIDGLILDLIGFLKCQHCHSIGYQNSLPLSKVA